MPETKNYVFNHLEIAELLIKKLELHEGFWGVYFEFGLTGANIPTSPDGKSVLPAAIAIIQKMGIQRFDSANSLTVDAGEVNPVVKSSGSKKSHSSRDLKN
jgi:hypothetical protein